MNISIIAILLIILTNIVEGNEFIKFNFDKLKEYTQEEQSADQEPLPIEIRGFLYTAKDGRKILSSAPDLKTCCIGSESRIAEQLVITPPEELPATSSVITIRGYLTIDPISDEEKRLIAINHISNSKIVEERGEWGLAAGITIAALCMGLLWKFWPGK